MFGNFVICALLLVTRLQSVCVPFSLTDVTWYTPGLAWPTGDLNGNSGCLYVSQESVRGIEWTVL